MAARIAVLIAGAMFAGGVSCRLLAQEVDMTLDKLREQRRELAFRNRGIMANNDGCDVLYYPKDSALSPERFLDMRTTALAGTHVGAIVYCTISSGFSFFTHHTTAGTVLTRQPADYGIQPHRRNVALELIEQGQDCLSLVTDFAHRHRMESFWSMRMNDTHDVAYRPDKPYLLYPPLKEEHPEWLVGEVAKRTAHGRWSSVNYAVPEIRDRALAYIEEVCRNYDIDGIELDYFRHMCYFPSVASGGVATDEERGLITDLMHRVRRMTETVGLERGRPFLVAVRVADSTAFNRDMGLDIERWLADGLVDILVTTCYFRLNRWETSVELGRRYGVAVYPSLSDSRVTGETRFSRKSAESYRGRAANVWAAGANGIHLFNYFNPRADLWREIGSPAALQGLPKLFFVTVRDGNPESWLAGGKAHLTVPILTPGTPLLLEPERTAVVDMDIGEDIAGAYEAGLTPKISAHMRLAGAGAALRLTVTLNDQTLTPMAHNDDWLDYIVPPEVLCRGANRFGFLLAPKPTDKADPWSLSYDGSALPNAPWAADSRSANVAVEVQDGALLVADRGTEAGDYRYYRANWCMGVAGGAVIEARVKVVSGVSSIIFGNGETGQRLCFRPDRIELYHDPDRRFIMDTTDDFHTYRIEVSGDDIQVFVDGEHRLDGKDCFRPGRTRYANQVAFGAANSPELGEALWRYVRAGTDAAGVLDLVVRVDYPHP